jgi:hypothetical protein
MAFTNCLKNIADLRQIIKNIAFNCNSNFSLKYVKSSFLIGIRIRSPIIPQNVLKVYREAKRASYFVYNFCSVCSVESRELIAGELKRLCEYSEKNNIEEVNHSIKSLLGNPDFGIQCYKSIKINSDAHSPSGSFFTEKRVTFTKINLNFFDKLSDVVFKGKFQFGSICRANVQKFQSNTHLFDITDSHGLIVQKGMAVILKTLSKHRFDECSFGFRRKDDVYGALAFIQKKVPIGM